MEFDSLVSPKIELGDEFTPTENIQSAFEKYNRHSHAFANTSNPWEMGLRTGFEIKYSKDETSIPSGTTILSLQENSITLSATSPIKIENDRFIVQGKFILDNCSIDQDSDILTLNTQHGFINSDSLKLLSYDNFNSFLDLSNFDPSQSPAIYPIYMNSDISRYLTKLKIITDSVEEINYKINLAYNENYENLVDDITRDNYIEFNTQTVNNNTFIPSNSLIEIEIDTVDPSVNFLFLHFKFSRVFL
mgnify:CR=1 FL=1